THTHTHTHAHARTHTHTHTHSTDTHTYTHTHTHTHAHTHTRTHTLTHTHTHTHTHVCQHCGEDPTESGSITQHHGSLHQLQSHIPIRSMFHLVSSVHPEKERFFRRGMMIYDVTL